MISVLSLESITMFSMFFWAKSVLILWAALLFGYVKKYQFDLLLFAHKNVVHSVH